MDELGFERNHSRFLVKETILFFSSKSLIEILDTLNEHKITPDLRNWNTVSAMIYPFIDINLH
jgi:hypothetical protein